ncbi:hypothetical protein K8I28_14790 [bacterium]|nr:hypothetical protein [bacterium]
MSPLKLISCLLITFLFATTVSGDEISPYPLLQRDASPIGFSLGGSLITRHGSPDLVYGNPAGLRPESERQGVNLSVFLRTDNSAVQSNIKSSDEPGDYLWGSLTMGYTRESRAYSFVPNQFGIGLGIRYFGAQVERYAVGTSNEPRYLGFSSNWTDMILTTSFYGYWNQGFGVGLNVHSALTSFGNRTANSFFSAFDLGFQYVALHRGKHALGLTLAALLRVEMDRTWDHNNFSESGLPLQSILGYRLEQDWGIIQGEFALVEATLRRVSLGYERTVLQGQIPMVGKRFDAILRGGSQAIRWKAAGTEVEEYSGIDYSIRLGFGMAVDTRLHIDFGIEIIELTTADYSRSLGHDLHPNQWLLSLSYLYHM